MYLIDPNTRNRFYKRGNSLKITLLYSIRDGEQFDSEGDLIENPLVYNKEFSRENFNVRCNEISRSGGADGSNPNQQDDVVDPSPEEEEEGYKKIMELISFKHPVMSFLLVDPPYLQLPHDYIIDNFSKIRSEIENSDAFKKSLNFPIKCEIKGDATFSNVKMEKFPKP